jgi:hypothetical protein
MQTLGGLSVSMNAHEKMQTVRAPLAARVCGSRPACSPFPA